MLFLIDEDMPRSMAKILAQAGYKAIDVRDTNLRGAQDKDIFTFACQNQATIITADVGFAGLSYKTSIDHYGLILLRIPNEFTITKTNELLLSSLHILREDDIVGNIVVIEPRKIRIRKKK